MLRIWWYVYTTFETITKMVFFNLPIAEIQLNIMSTNFYVPELRIAERDRVPGNPLQRCHHLFVGHGLLDKHRYQTYDATVEGLTLILIHPSQYY